MDSPFKRLISPPTFPDPDKSYTASVLHIIILTTLVAALLGIGAALYQDNTTIALVLAVIGAVLTPALWLVRRGYVRFPSYVVPLLVFGFVTYAAFQGEGVHDITTFGYWVPIALGSLLLGANAPLIFSGLTVLALLGLYAAEQTGLIVPVNPAGIEDVAVLSIFIGMSAVLMRVMMVNLIKSRNQARQSEVEVRQLNEALEQRVADRTRELEISRREAVNARAAAEQANAAKSRFLANMSHELRTPLNAILNFTAFVADGIMGPVNDEQKDALTQSVSSARHLLSLINDVLDITKIEAGMMDLFVEQVNLKEIVEATVSIGHGLVKEKPVQLIAEIGPDLPTSFGDKRRLRQIFLNLISNAVKFTAQGTITLSAARQDGGVLITVKDTGTGIAPEDHGTIFESFKQVGKHEDLVGTVGTGLGLPITKFFVESHQGRLWLESEIGQGTTFFVYLPTLTQEQAESMRQLAAFAR